MGNFQLSISFVFQLKSWILTAAKLNFLLSFVFHRKSFQFPAAGSTTCSRRFVCLSIKIFICTETFHLRSHYVRSKLPRTKDSFDSCLLLHLFRGAAFVGNTFGHLDDFDSISGKKKHIQRSREVYCIHLFYK